MKLGSQKQVQGGSTNKGIGSMPFSTQSQKINGKAKGCSPDVRKGRPWVILSHHCHCIFPLKTKSDVFFPRIYSNLDSIVQ